jgi:hypothetical protein
MQYPASKLGLGLVSWPIGNVLLDVRLHFRQRFLKLRKGVQEAACGAYDVF